jgi:hypothetical protein
MRQARFRRACWWLSRDVPVLPLKPRSKHLQPGYGPRQTLITDPAFARQWFTHTDANLGVLLGESAGLVVADWDDAQAYQLWLTSSGAAVDTLTERTTRGYHAFFFAQDLLSAVGNQCEFKTTGVCMVSPSIHPSGLVYRILNHAPIALLDREKAGLLFPFLSEEHDRKARSALENPATENAPGPQRRGGLIARIKASRSILDEVCAAGVTLSPAGTNTLVGLCPFHNDHSPSFWLNPQSGLWGCNRPDCAAAGIHDVINFRALIRGISNRAAIKQLADQFL